MSAYETVKEMCREKGMTIRELEIRAGVGNGTIGKWRSCLPHVSTLEKVAGALDTPVAILLDIITSTG